MLHISSNCYLLALRLKIKKRRRKKKGEGVLQANQQNKQKKGWGGRKKTKRRHLWKVGRIMAKSRKNDDSWT